jgi:hypothetical protein
VETTQLASCDSVQAVVPHMAHAAAWYVEPSFLPSDCGRGIDGSQRCAFGYPVEDMKCPYCAEEIQDAALLCRFCGARRLGSEWSAPARPTSTRKSNFTIASTGWLLLLSGAGSVLDLGAPLPWFPRAGAWAAYVFNGSLAALLCAMGFALARRRPWALPVTLATSVLYTLDKLGLILQGPAEQGALGDLAAIGELAPLVHEVSRSAALLFLLGWWSFVLYLGWKRGYFRAG